MLNDNSQIYYGAGDGGMKNKITLTRADRVFVIDDEVIETFWSHVEIPTPLSLCWRWKSGLTVNYGWIQIVNDRKKVNWGVIAPSRLSYAIHFGDPGNLNVCHKCDNKCCVNPAHLFLGTHGDNLRDFWRKSRTVGYTHGGITEQDAITIREMFFKKNLSIKRIARNFRLLPETIERVLAFENESKKSKDVIRQEWQIDT